MFRVRGVGGVEGEGEIHDWRVDRGGRQCKRSRADPHDNKKKTLRLTLAQTSERDVQIGSGTTVQGLTSDGDVTTDDGLDTELSRA